MPRERVPPLRAFAVEEREDFAAPLLPRDDLAGVDRLAAGLLAADERLEAAADFPRLVFAFDAVERFADEALPAPAERPEDPRDELDEPALLALADPSIDHLPVITRCAASATASAMIDPSLVALDTMLLAACDAVSAASSPASRILRRADGLALIAAAAAARPAASISLLIAALASLSTVDSFDPDEDPDDEEPEEVDPEELLRADFAIA